MPSTVYEFDPSKSNPSNLIINEIHNLDQSTARIIVPRYGLYYVSTLIVKLVSTNQTLTAGTSYQYNTLDTDITSLTGYSCAAGIDFIDLNLAGEVSISYQVVGGNEGTNSAIIFDLQEQIAGLTAANISWENVQNKPVYYPPEPHGHSLVTDLSDLDRIRNSMEGLTDALVNNRGHIGSQRKLHDTIERLKALISIQRNDITTLLATPATIGADITRIDNELIELIATMNEQLLPIINRVEDITDTLIHESLKDTDDKIGSVTKSLTDLNDIRYINWDDTELDEVVYADLLEALGATAITTGVTSGHFKLPVNSNNDPYLYVRAL